MFILPLETETTDTQTLTTMEQIYKDLAKFMVETIEDYENRAQLALNIIDHNRCSLQQADNSLYNKMYDTAEEFINDNKLDVDIDDIDIETILFTL